MSTAVNTPSRRRADTSGRCSARRRLQQGLRLLFDGHYTAIRLPFDDCCKKRKRSFFRRKSSDGGSAVASRPNGGRIEVVMHNTLHLHGRQFQLICSKHWASGAKLIIMEATSRKCSDHELESLILPSGRHQIESNHLELWCCNNLYRKSKV